MMPGGQKRERKETLGLVGWLGCSRLHDGAVLGRPKFALRGRLLRLTPSGREPALPYLVEGPVQHRNDERGQVDDRWSKKEVAYEEGEEKRQSPRPKHAYAPPS